LQSKNKTISVIIPAKNEEASLSMLLQNLINKLGDAEIIVVNDGSTDDTAQIINQAGAKLISHPYSMGNGAAIKAGARAATGELIVTMDADGQHNPADIKKLLEKKR